MVVAVLVLLKQILGITDDGQDALLNHYLEQAANTACVYCNVDQLPEQFDGTVTDLAAHLYGNREYGGVKAKTQGERTVSYFEEADIPAHIKAALPLPNVRVMGNVL